MNILDLLILAILAYGLLAGMYKGMLTSLMSLLAFGGAWFGAKALYARIANFALSNTTLMAVLNQYLEPEEFFSSHTEAITAVSDVVVGGESALTQAVNALSGTFSFLSDAFSNNIRTEAFADLGITTLSDYLNQTLWVAVFNVVAFIAAFIVLYVVLSLLVNLIDHVVSLPILRGFDWLIGGICGLARASVVVVLVLAILPVLTSMISPELTTQLQSESVLYSFASQFDLLNVKGWLQTLIMG